MKTGQKKRLLGGIKKTKKPCGKDGMSPPWRRRNCRATRTSQRRASISVRPPRQKYVQFCSTPLPTPRRNLPTASTCSGGNCWPPRKPTSLPTETPCCHVPGLSRCIHTTPSAGCHGVRDQKPDGSEAGVSRSMKTGHKKRLLGGIERIISVRPQCIDFCEVTTAKVHAVLQRAPPDLRGGIFFQHSRVLVATHTVEHRTHNIVTRAQCST